MSTTTMEEVFKAGFEAAMSGAYKDENSSDYAWEVYRYDSLKRVSGKEAADEWLIARNQPKAVIENLKCPDCDGEMTPRSSQYGKFWGCKNYPKCKGTRDSEGLSKAERLAERNKHASIDEPMPEYVEDDQINKGFTFKKG